MQQAGHEYLTINGHNHSSALSLDMLRILRNHYKMDKLQYNSQLLFHQPYRYNGNNDHALASLLKNPPRNKDTYELLTYH